MKKELQIKNADISQHKIELDAYVEDVSVLPVRGSVLRAAITLRPLGALLTIIQPTFWQRLYTLVCETEPPQRDWAEHVAKPIQTRKNAPDWIRERNEVLNRIPLVRIHDA